MKNDLLEITRSSCNYPRQKKKKQKKKDRKRVHKEIDRSEIKRIIRKLKRGKSLEANGINPELLHFGEVVIDWMSLICKQA